MALRFGNAALWQPAAITAILTLALGLRCIPALKGFQFTVWIVAAVTCALIYPNGFLKWGSLDLRNKWLLLVVVQMVMFGMGTQMSVHDFSGLAKAPRGVLVGIICHFTVMPLVGFGITKLFRFPPEIAAGIVLIGSCSSGLASNVMAWLAQANLALSVTVTAITTMIAPLMTPLWMTLLAGTLINVDAFNMMLEIIKLVLVPIGAALLHDYLKRASPKGHRAVSAIAVLAVLWLLLVPVLSWNWFKAHLSAGALSGAGLIGFFCGSVLVGIIYHSLSGRWPSLERKVPVLSMAGIVYFTLVTTAAGRDNLLQIGGLLFLASAIHNAAGYCFGYWLSRGAGLDRNSARSVAFEVGLQNGGMASGIAGALGKLGTLGLAAAVFSPWMNFSGSLLANYWRARPVQKPVAENSQT